MPVQQDQNHQPAGAEVQRHLLRKLLTEKISFGQQFNEAQLAREFNVTRQAIREALCQAVGWGVIEYVPYRGFQIRDFTMREIVDWYKLRLAIEPLAAREIAERRPQATLKALSTQCQLERRAFAVGDFDGIGEANREFHRTIVSGCGNSQYAKSAILAGFAVCFNFDRELRTTLGYLRFHGGEIVSEEEQKKYLYIQCTGTVHQDADTLKILASGTPAQAEKRVRWYMDRVLAQTLITFESYGDPDTPLSQMVKNYRRYFRKSARPGN